MGKPYHQFKVLLVYPNIQMRTIPPPGLALIAAVLKQGDFQVDVFDATRYEDIYTSPEEDYDSSHEKFLRMDIHKDRVKNSNVPSFSWKSRNIQLKSSSMLADFRNKIECYGPDLVAFSLVENTYGLGMRMLDLVPDSINVVVGGVFATYAPEICIRHPKVNFVCRGEGEYPMLDLAQALAQEKPSTGIANIWAKDEDLIYRNPMRPAIDVNTLPLPDYGIFEDELFYTPMQGRVWRVLGFETQRGCPYTCTYCNSPSNNTTYAAETSSRFYRKKTIPTLVREMDALVAKYKPELIYFVADTFLAMNRRELDEFSEFYQSYKFPFWMNTRAETITEHSAAHLAKMNCLRFNIGIEHGNEAFRAQVLKRKVSNDKMVKAFEIAASYADDFTCVANSIIGLPTETPDLLFDTIELNRRLPDEIVAAGAFVFAPYHGTPLRRLALEKGYITSDLICTEGSNTSGGSLLNMPEFPKEEIEGFMKTFSFYVKFPKSRWSEIDLARKPSPEGMAAFERLREEYAETYLNPIKVREKPDWQTEQEPSPTL